MIQLLDFECLQVQEISLQNHITFYKKTIFQEKHGTLVFERDATFKFLEFM